MNAAAAADAVTGACGTLTPNGCAVGPYGVGAGADDVAAYDVGARVGIGYGYGECREECEPGGARRPEDVVPVGAIERGGTYENPSYVPGGYDAAAAGPDTGPSAE